TSASSAGATSRLQGSRTCTPSRCSRLPGRGSRRSISPLVEASRRSGRGARARSSCTRCARPRSRRPLSGARVRDRALVRARRRLRRRAGRSHPARRGQTRLDLPRHPRPGALRRRAGSALARVPSALREEPALLRRLHGAQRQHGDRRVPRAQSAADAGARARRLRRSGAEPQRRPARVRPGRAAVVGKRRRRRKRRPVRQRPAGDRQFREDQAARRGRTHRSLGDVGDRPAQSVALLVRPEDGRPVHRRRRPERLGGDRLRPARTIAPRLRLEPLRRPPAVRPREPRAGVDVRAPRPCLRARRRRLLRHGRLCLPRSDGRERRRAVLLRRLLQRARLERSHGRWKGDVAPARAVRRRIARLVRRGRAWRALPRVPGGPGLPARRLTVAAMKAAAALVAALAFAAPALAAGWPEFGYGPARQNAGRTIYVTTTYARTEAIDAKTGAVRWRYTPKTYDSYAGSYRITNMTPTVDPDGSAVYAGAPDGRI